MPEARPIHASNETPVPLPAARREPAAVVLARNLVIARDLAGMTQHDLAARSGVSRATIAQIESGGGDPRLSTISEVAQALGISVVVLLAGRRDVKAISGVCLNLASSPVRVDAQDQERMTAFAESSLARDWRRAARIGAAIGRAAGCKSPGAAATAGLFSVVVPGRGTAIGAALGRLLE